MRGCTRWTWYEFLLPWLGENERSLAIMANVRKRSISLTPDLDSVVERWIASGRYASRSEVIRAALRALEREEEERAGKPAAFTAEIARRVAAAQFPR